MLTKTDLSAIKKIVKEVVRVEIEAEVSPLKDALQAEIKLARLETQREIKLLKDEVKELRIKLTKVEKDVALIVKIFDREYLDLRKDVEGIKEHLNLTA
ncbi:MAG: hypothetical protein A2Y57_03865 [Candidatus Woykebacteria bacterium RBG_13_40_7b]|uniref:Uncharacterized protein n=1 Tax=Candidatus Woykebacteria bacterium RBG_13_40_7b TaxID=1802594 RepID=A0A1G1WB49_9BACT|nr:MAG: hypothetical protein A2Y57_03865 [Candidatus Woykebacteria bacterium RBG_13_40_7b]